MTSSDEPIFLETDTGWGTGNFVAPGEHYYVGAIAESEIPADMPVVYLDWQVAMTLQAEGQRSIETDKEVAGILLGTSAGDYESIKVTHIAIARDEDSSPVHFKFTFSVWDDLIDQMEQMSREAGEELLLLGWYHTHPNMAVFLSRYDLLTHRDFHRPYQFALVLAPQLGTEETSVGFFCNRGAGTPLLPGIRLFGPIPRREVAGRLPWRFQVLADEGVEEGEFATAAASSRGIPRGIEREVHQLGVVRREAPEWLLLGHDVNEGPVLPILEQQAAKVVDEGTDQLGVLLGTQSAENHVRVTRVRFMGGVLSASNDKEEAELLVALGFMARTFPAHGEEKIVGLVRIVAPQQFAAGDSYDPLSHNIRLPALLAELKYDLDQVPFQVGLVLYPGIEEETFMFQVFAQHKSSKPIPLMSMQAEAPGALRANERYEPIAGMIFEIEDEPCMTAPEVLRHGPRARRDERIVHTGTNNPVLSSPELSAGSAEISAINWDDVEDDDTEHGVKPSTGLPLVMVLMSVLLFLVAVLLLVQLTDPFAPDPLAEEQSPRLLEGDEAMVGKPYDYTVVGCGGDWNPALPCRPSLGGDSRLTLVELRTLEFYNEQTIQSPDVWLVPQPGDDRPRIRLDSRREGNSYWFSVTRRHKSWARFWGDGTVFPVRLVIVPHGAELVEDDELTYLRRGEDLQLDGSILQGAAEVVTTQPETQTQPETEARTAAEADEVAPAELEDPGTVTAAALAEGGDAGSGEWSWHNIGSRHKMSYHVGRQSFAGTLEVSGGAAAEGQWRMEYRTQERGVAVHTATVDDLAYQRGKVDLAQALTGFMRASTVVASLEAESGLEDSSVYLVVRAPGVAKGESGEGVLSLKLALEGSAAASSIKHRVCVMMSYPGDAAVTGQARISSQGEMRTTFAIDSGGKPECADGGNSGRWTGATFGPGKTQLRFVYLGDGTEAAAAKGKEQRYTLSERWNSAKPSCIAITIDLDVTGRLVKSPSLKSLYPLLEGRCQ